MEVIQLDKDRLTADQVLENAKGHYDSVLILGWNKEDELEMFSSSNMTKACDLNYLLSLVQHKLLSGEYS